jgi:hypothetical protein
MIACRVRFGKKSKVVIPVSGTSGMVLYMTAVLDHTTLVPGQVIRYHTSIRIPVSIPGTSTGTRYQHTWLVETVLVRETFLDTRIQ